MTADYEAAKAKLEAVNQRRDNYDGNEGVRYRRWFRPLTRSNSGKSVREWSKGWETVS